MWTLPKKFGGMPLPSNLPVPSALLPPVVLTFQLKKMASMFTVGRSL